MLLKRGDWFFIPETKQLGIALVDDPSEAPGSIVAWNADGSLVPKGEIVRGNARVVSNMDQALKGLAQVVDEAFSAEPLVPAA